MTPAQAIAHVQARLGRSAIRAEPLHGGLLNHVFRVMCDDGDPVVVKHAPPFVASAPHVPLDAGRSDVEATALHFLAGARVPRLIDHHGRTVILEDIGEWPDLVTFLRSGGEKAILDRLGRWLRALHEGPQPAIDNRSMQRTRLELQYAPARQWLEARGHSEAERVGSLLLDLGQRFLEGGSHFVMGDFWPPSVRVLGPADFVVLDWELSTCGHRAQDLGHMMAHLHLEAVSDARFGGAADRLYRAYGPLTPEEARDTRLHQAAELLARTVGAFPREGLSEGGVDQLVDDACALALEALDIAPPSSL